MLNKHVILTTAALLGLPIATGLVHAQPTKSMGFNLGAELSVLNKPSINEDFAEAKGFEKNKMGANFFLGSRFDENFGAELGYGFITKTTESSGDGVTATHKVRNIYVDALGYYPVTSNTDLIGAIGVGRFKSKLAIPSPSPEATAIINSANKAKVGLRIGLGAQYNFCANWSSRVMVRYQRGNRHFLRDNVSIALGAAYTI